MSERAPKVKNKAAAELQISYEQILQEAYDRKEAPLQLKQNLADLEELKDTQERVRKQYEGALRRNRLAVDQWKRYANYELSFKEYTRARSIFERALESNPTSIDLWLNYARAEMKAGNVNHARNLLDRAVTTLPRVSKLWFEYVRMEQILQSYESCRRVFERWMEWRPEPAAWIAYITFEKKLGEYENARKVFQMFTILYAQEVDVWLKWVKFEDEYGTQDTVRDVFTLATDVMAEQLGENRINQKLLIAWAQWETRQKEWERARAIYKYGLQCLGTSFEASGELQQKYTEFEKQFGEKEGIEAVVLEKRKARYEADLTEDPKDVDTWFLYLTLLEEMNESSETVRAAYEKAVAQVPENRSEKRYWRRYIFLWIKYAFWSEFSHQKKEETEAIYRRAIELIPHSKFTFGKIWILYAKYEIRCGNITQARKILGNGIGRCPKPKLFKGYIELELKLKEFERSRKLYGRFVETFPHSSVAWISFAEFEESLAEFERARAIYQTALSQDLDVPEVLWGRFIEFETEQYNYDGARKLYEQLVEKSRSVKTWISYVYFELAVPSPEQLESLQSDETEVEIEVTSEAKEGARDVFRKAWEQFKKDGKKEERVVLFDHWKTFEIEYGDETSQSELEKRKPTIVRKRVAHDQIMEEYDDYIFPSDEEARDFSKFLENARNWKLQQKANT